MEFIKEEIENSRLDHNEPAFSIIWKQILIDITAESACAWYINTWLPGSTLESCSLWCLKQ
jgi:hypothetical protein